MDLGSAPFLPAPAARPARAPAARVSAAFALAAAALLAPLALAAPAFASPPPSSTTPTAGYTFERESATTLDGALLEIRRFKVQGAVPVLLLHGIGSNSNEWDLPSKSFARFLAARGYDVWAANHRRVGKRGPRSSGARGYGFDELACLDVPALVERVRAETGERPFIVGHSMGGMMAEAWLQGVALESVRVARVPRVSLSGVRWQDVFARRVTADPARIAARGAAIRGVVAIASPPRFDWPARGANALTFWNYNYWDYNILLRHLAWSPAANAAALAVDEVPGGEVADFLTDALPSLPHFGPTLRPYLRAVTAQVGRSFLTAEVLYGPNMEAPVLIEAVDDAVDDSSGVTMRQFMDGIRLRTFRDRHTLDPLRAPHVYADHWGDITAPFLVVGGRYDKLCNDDTLEREGYARLGSADKTYLALDCGHVDLVIGRDAPRDLWDPVVRWLDVRK